MDTPNDRQIRTNAGLDESRLNQDFVDFLKKWSVPLLGVVAAVVGAYAAVNYYQQSRRAALESAFRDLSSEQRTGSPAGLLRVAKDHGGVGSVAILAKLDAADIFALAAFSGLAPGAELDAQRAPKKPEDLLGPEARATTLAQAATLYEEVIDATADEPGMEAHALRAIFWLAAARETQQRFDEAKALYERAAGLAERTNKPALAAVAKKRLETMADAMSAPALPREAEVVTAAKKPEVPTQLPAEVLEQLQRGEQPTLTPGAPAGEPAPAPAGEPAPAPVPAPAPAPAATEPAPPAPK